MHNSILSRFTTYILGTLCVIWISNCSPSEPLSPDTVATVGNRTITISDFQRAYLPILLYTNEKDNEQTRERVLNDLLGIKILAQTAESIDLDTISEIDAWVEPIRRNALLRKMYASEITAKISTPTEAGLRQGFQRTNEIRLVRHLFVQDQSTADRLYRAIQAGETDFYTAAQQVFQDSLLRNNGGELGWVRFGELDAVLEDTIYALDPGRLSHPTRSSYGWHLVIVDGIQRNKLLTESDYQLLKPRIERIIKKRQTFQRSREFINDFMQQIDLTFNEEIAAPVIRNLADRLVSIRDNAVNEELTNLSQREIGYLQNDLTPYLEEELLRFQDEIWTVADLVKRLPFLSTRLMFQNLYTAIAYLVRDEVLLPEAEERGFRDDQEVRAEVQDRRDQILAQLFMQSQWDSLSITPETLKKYYRDTWAVQYSGPDSLYLVGLRLTNPDAAENILGQASTGKTLRQLYADTGIGELKSLGWQVQHATAYPVLYNQLVQEPLLTIKGPIQTQGAWWLVQATSRHRYPLPYDQIQRQVENDYRAEQWRIFRFKLVEENQSKFDVTLNIERLHTFTESGQ
ncbi:MAG: peptidylprolyl isomerase [Candidatus Marinimicrobia bacterium]|nr:peptidylprolyl isomerase [Candidatus Neomarinimicrobiota bacterium]MCF7840607.1 peptidylprolyl isomerase [Candidatus Neomarinimicrobiota bacterium]